MTDYFFFGGEIRRLRDLDFIECVHKYKGTSSKDCVVIVSSSGGDPDAAYKMSRYLQHRYDSYSVLIAGLCKSAATLFAIGAKELIFSPYGELGPLDIQLQKEDNLFGQESGLNITEAFRTLESQARETYNKVLMDIIRNSGGVVAFKTASEVANGMVSALYGPIFSQIEPEEVGSRMRAMRIGEDYAKRLNIYGNLKHNALKSLSSDYTSHSFVIDYIEAKTLFNEVRLVDDAEAALVESLGRSCRYPLKQDIKKLELELPKTTKGNKNAKPKRTAPTKSVKPKQNRASGRTNGKNPPRTSTA